RQGVSVERVAGQLLQRGLEWERRRTELPTYHDFDALAGTWSEDEAMAFLQAVADFEHEDPALWPLGTFCSVPMSMWPSNRGHPRRWSCSRMSRALGSTVLCSANCPVLF